MKSYVYENVKIAEGKRFITRYSLEEYFVASIVKFLLFLFIIWPLEIFVWWPIKIIFKGILILIEFVFRGVFWLIKLPFYLLFTKKLPDF